MITCIKCNCEYECYGQRRKICKPCKREYDREYHTKRSYSAKQTKLKNQKNRIDIARQFIWDYFKSNPCVQCGESDPIVLEFDHVDQSDKSFVIANMVTYSVSTIQKEINKCRVLCANCHRRHTATQMGWYKNISL